MAGRRTKPEAVVPTTAIVASAVRYTGEVPRIYNPSRQWQDEAYRHYNICGEARYAANYVGNSLSRARLYAAGPSAGQMVEAAEDSASAKALAELFGGPDGRPALLKAIGVHLTIAGECYLVGREPTGIPERDRGADPEADTVWEIVSVQELNVTGTRWTIRYGDGHPDVQLGKEDVIIRIWTPDPAKRMEADSPFKSALPVLSEIEYLTLHIFAQCRSRLAGAGILWVPSEMDFPPPPEVNGEPVQVNTEDEGLMLQLAEAMIEDIHDQGDPNSVVPIALSAPGEHIDKARLMHFWSDLDEKALEMRQAAIHRFALGMDLPPEQILGMGSNGGSGGGTSNGVSHWGAWQIDESTIKLHVEPMLDAVVSALTISYLRPLLPVTDPSVVLYDTTALRLRPDRSKEALELYDRGLLKASIAVTENGFSAKDDMPSEEELQRWLLIKVASGSATPEQVHSALKELGVDLGDLEQPNAIPRESRPTPSLEGHETRREPERQVASVTPVDLVLLNVSHSLVFRALERAGNRLRQTVPPASKPQCPAYETHTLIQANGSTDTVLADAFGNANLVLDGIADYTAVVPVLQDYARDLLRSGVRHDKANLETYLRDAELIA